MDKKRYVLGESYIVHSIMRDAKTLVQGRRIVADGLAPALRRAARLSQEEVGAHCGVSAAAVSRWERRLRVGRGDPARRYAELLVEIMRGPADGA